MSVWDHLPHPEVAPPRPGRGAHRAGLAGNGRGYVLIVASLVGLASLPTLVVVTVGSASVRRDTGTPEPFVVGELPPPVLVVPVAPEPGPRPLRQSVPQEAPAPVATPTPTRRTRTKPHPVPARAEAGTPKNCAERRAPRSIHPRKHRGHYAPGRSIGGWSRAAGPRR